MKIKLHVLLGKDISIKALFINSKRLSLDLTDH
jgi:hypothetical protein